MDFFEPAKKAVKGVYYVAPKFKICRSKDLMIRGKDFYAIWDEENSRWSRDLNDAIRIIDKETRDYILAHKNDDEPYRPQYMWDADTGIIDKWNKYVQRQMPDNYQPLDNKVIFSNTDVRREDYSTHRLSYPLQEGPITNYEELISTLYEPDERKKIEWAIGAIVSGDSTWIQKFIVLVGDPGTGKSTILKIIRMLFKGYCATIDAKALGDGHSSFALEPLKNDPLVAIQDDADLSRINDNTRLNSLVSHEPMTVNEKFKAQYENTFHAFLFLGTNNDVRITDSASGLTRRLIDVMPSGNKVSVDRYHEIMKQIPFELGGIAYHCLKVYQHNKKKYDDYKPVRMLRATNLVYNFLEENYETLMTESDGCRYYDIWNSYQTYCDIGKIEHPHDRQELRRELRPYFKEYYRTYEYKPGQTCNGYFKGFRYEKFDAVNPFLEPKVEDSEPITNDIPDWLIMDKSVSKLDDFLSDYPAQYTSTDDEARPKNRWVNCKTKLSDISTTQLHYVKTPINLIVIDLDIRNKEGKKDREANLKAASQFPPTYAEWSKSGAGIHLHYIYQGDVEKLSHVFDDNIEIKTFPGDSSLRRKLCGCNNLDIATINSGLPLKKEMIKMTDRDGLKTERAIRTCIKRNLRKEYHGATKPSVDFIFKILEDAYNDEDVRYDVTDLRPSILTFAANSTHQSDACLKKVSKMKWKSKIFEINDENEKNTRDNKFVEDDAPIVFFDVEVFPNLFVVCWKIQGKEQVTSMINPTPKECEALLKYKLIGFNNLKYDNHILYARIMGYTNSELYKLSQRIVSNDKNAMFSEAYNISYTDIYDFSNTKQSLKKFEIEIGIHHLELGLRWDMEVPNELWAKVAEYCCNDVIATEATFNYLADDWIARQVLSELSGLSLNHSTNAHTQQIIFGSNKNPQGDFIYTDLSIMFPGYKFENGKSTYMDEEIGEGGKVYAEPGIYYNVALLDITSMHPHSAYALKIFGEYYTERYMDLVRTRVHIKHKEESDARAMFDGRIGEIADKLNISLKQLDKSLKVPINAVYGLTSAKFPNRCKDPRNVDNIVAKRGALFMTNLKYEVQKRGYTVAHIKTDSIKIPNADMSIINFVMEYGKKYGYNFEHEATYDRMCLVNDAVYIAKYQDKETCMYQYGYIPDKNNGHAGEWTATGAQFAVPYVFKTLFSGETIEFTDLCEVKSVTSALYLDMNEGYPDVSEWEKLKKTRGRTGDKLTKNEMILLDRYNYISDEELDSKIGEGHNYQFVGRIGQFCPIMSGHGGGWLCREKDGKYNSATGAKGFRWMESEMVKSLGLENYIDKDYFRMLVDNAKATIEEYGSFDDFIFDLNDEDVPF